MRIVYVEDNLANVHLVKRVARMGNHEVINYIDGMDAFNNFATDHPDLVLMDIQLAGELTGIEVVKKLRDKGFETPIYAVTAYAMVGDRERCIEAGCTGYMSKPIPVTELVTLFQKYNVPTVPEKSSPAIAEDVTEAPKNEDNEQATAPAVAPLPDTDTVNMTREEVDSALETKSTPEFDPNEALTVVARPDELEKIVANADTISEDETDETVTQDVNKDEDVTSTKPSRTTKPLRPMLKIDVDQGDSMDNERASSMTKSSKLEQVPESTDSTKAEIQ